GPRIRGNEFIHGGLELCALPIRVTCNRSAQAFELLSEDSVSQRLSTYVEIAVAVCLCHLWERPYDHFRRIVRICMIPRDGRLAIGFPVFLNEGGIALAHGLDGNIGIANVKPNYGRASSLDELGRCQ